MRLLLICICLGLAFPAFAAEDDFSNHEANQKIIQYYEKAPDQWPKDQRVKVAICYAMEGSLPKAEELYLKILADTPNEARAFRGLGTCYIFKQKPEQAAKMFEKGWQLGDVECLRQLAASYLMMGKLDEIKPLISDLLKNRSKSPEITPLVMVYSLNAKPADKDAFFKALEGMSDDALLKRPDMLKVAIAGLETFGDLERATRLRNAMK